MSTGNSVIVIESEAFFALLDEVVSRIAPKPVKEWILQDEAMGLLGIKSKTTLFEMRAQGSIKYTQPRQKLILYSRTSIMEFLEAHAQKTF